MYVCMYVCMYGGRGATLGKEERYWGERSNIGEREANMGGVDGLYVFNIS